MVLTDGSKEFILEKSNNTLYYKRFNVKNLLFIVESSVLGVKYLCEAAKYLNFYPVILSEITNQEGDAKKQILDETYLKCDTSSFNGIVAGIQDYHKMEENKKIEGLVTLLDSRLHICSEVSQFLNLKGIESSCQTTKNKQNICNDIEEYSPKYFSLEDFYSNKIDNFFKNNEKICIKLKYGAGGKGFFIVDTFEILLEEISKRSSSPEEFFSQYFLQQYINGELVSVEGYFLNNEVNIFEFTGRRKIKDTECSLVFPYSKNITSIQKDKIYDCLLKIKSFYNLKKSFFHIEFIITGNEIYLIDANIGRPPGGNLIELICYSFGISVTDFFKNYLSILLKNNEFLNFKKIKIKDSIYTFNETLNSSKSYLGVGYGVPLSTTFISLDYALNNNISYINAIDPNTKVCQMGETNWAWVGLVSGEESNVISEINKIKINTTDGVFSPVWQ